MVAPRGKLIARRHTESCPMWLVVCPTRKYPGQCRTDDQKDIAIGLIGKVFIQLGILQPGDRFGDALQLIKQFYQRMVKTGKKKIITGRLPAQAADDLKRDGYPCNMPHGAGRSNSRQPSVKT